MLCKQVSGECGLITPTVASAQRVRQARHACPLNTVVEFAGSRVVGRKAVGVVPVKASRLSRQRVVSVEARKVAVLGAAGGIGQPLSLLLKMNKFVTELALYDVFNV